MRKKSKFIGLNEPLRHPDHPRPRTRREFIAQGFMTGAATVMVPSVLSGLLVPRGALGQQVLDPNLSPDIEQFARLTCKITGGAGKIPFIAFDLAGGANIAGSNVLIGKQGGQLDFLTTAGYSKLGLPGNMIPNPSTTGNFIDSTFGLRFHSDSAFLRGMMVRTKSASTRTNTSGAVIAARSENDTGNNPHNPMYGIAAAKAKGQLLGLIGTQSSVSGGNSMAPAVMIDVTQQPTKVDRSSDVVGLVDTGELGTLLPRQDATAVMESIKRVSDYKFDSVSAYSDSTTDTSSKQLAQCSYAKAAYLTDNFNDKAALNPDVDPQIVGPNGIFTQAEYDADAEFRKTSAVMKMVIDGNAGAGTITMGGFDYHTGDRMTGEARDFRAGNCMGACLEYAARKGKPLMLYVFSDGSLSSNGMIDNSPGGRGKGVWTGDNQSTASTFFLVFNPSGRPTHMPDANQPNDGRMQIGWFNGDGSINTASSPLGNAVNQLSAAIVLNYMALHGDQGEFQNLFKPHGNWSGIGSGVMDSLTAFAPICNGTIASPV